ncbi:ATP-dependent DNA helicase PIF1-like [Macadamia integrifolia]|uniref:ATP-dependent DNA helicase PIF1-like n=1 Tax=Macadamia integrifolia TaxID=60698 RepID=UPI001C533E0C|nr:ATP-dependent DNA helicase PIF1-like [Macadamia integrifolia]
MRSNNTEIEDGCLHKKQWRIFEFNLNEMFPYVINLQLHLRNKQMIWYWERQNLENILQSDNSSKAMLTEFFNMNSNDPKARKYLYREVPEHYVWNRQRKCWTTRQIKESIGLVNSANPSEGERFYLRLLLNHIRGPTSFRDLMCIDGIKCSSFKEAAKKRGLLKSDEAILECLKDLAHFQMPKIIRKLFVVIIVHREPGDVKKLWDENFEAMSEDIRRTTGTTEYHILQTLRDVNSFLESMGKSINQYDLPRVENDPDLTQKNQAREFSDECSIQVPLEDYDAQYMLNFEQKIAYNLILNQVNSKKSGIFFIDGPEGTGKTFLYHALLAKIRSTNEIALAIATSGVAVAIMPGERTAHSRFKILININDSSVCNFLKQSAMAKLIRRAKLIIWDEAPMAKRQAIEVVDRTLQDIMDNVEPFGGKVFVFEGDFRQLLPVVPRATRTEMIDARLVRLWPKMVKLQLKTNMRARNDPSFSEFLLRVGNGEEPTELEDLIRILDELLIQYKHEDTSEDELINAIFPSLQQHANSTEYIKDRSILATKNDTVDKLNDKLIEQFLGESVIYYNFDSTTDDAQTQYPEEFLNSLAPNGLPPHKLVLKKNCPIMSLRNLDPAHGECNGTRLVCWEFRRNVVLAEITIGQFSGNLVPLPRIPLCPTENEGYPFHLKESNSQ